MDLLLHGVSTLLHTMATALGGWSFGHSLATDIEGIMPYLHKANYLLPVDDVLTLCGLYVTIQLVLAAFYWITRTINLIRGAG